MFTGDEFVAVVTNLGVTHIVWVPDSTLGQWETDIRASPTIRLVTVCREGEAWAVAMGLHLGGAKPLVVIQCTGFFESGDAMRNVIHDLAVPIFAVIGYRSYLNDSTLPGDTARVYAEPILKAWNINYRLIDEPAKRDVFREHYLACEKAGKAGAVLIAEGRA